VRTRDHALGPPADPGREALDAAALQAAVVRPGGLWRSVEVTDVTGSTNADLLARAARGEPEGAVLAAEQQSAGRGRMGRAWVAPPRAALTFSLLIRPQAVPRSRYGWLPLLAGVAVASAVNSAAGVDARLKWPNDVLAAGAKLGGILAEAAGDALVVGIGINVSTEPGELPPPGPGALPATSLRALGSPSLDRAPLLTEILAGFERRYRAWCRAAGDPARSGLRQEYTRLCDTIGRRVRVELPGGQQLSGHAAGLDSDGRLILRSAPGSDLAGSELAGSELAGSELTGSELTVAAGDVIHLR
jgi:BirA family transcriptional regulator, biotin operon repressor / biotin---[acetyl-CoA-carboxylase] ligase